MDSIKFVLKRVITEAVTNHLNGYGGFMEGFAVPLAPSKHDSLQNGRFFMNGSVFSIKPFCLYASRRALLTLHRW